LILLIFRIIRSFGLTLFLAGFFLVSARGGRDVVGLRLRAEHLRANGERQDKSK
jgi:hypothetical protein